MDATISYMRTKSLKSASKGLVAGAAGGLVASFAMSRFHSLFHMEPDTKEQAAEDSTVKAASAISHTIFHHELTPRQKEAAAPAVHYGFGATMAASYGLAVELAPRLRTGWGTPFGASVWTGAHLITVPALVLSKPVTESSPRQEALEFGAHLLYGAVTEGIRRLLRKYVLMD